MVTKSNFQQRLLFLITLTLRRNNLWFTALKALEASIERTASESSLLKIWLIAWMAASPPDSLPAHTYRFPTDLIMSSFNAWTLVLPMILLMILQTPIDWSPELLSKGMSLLAENASRESVWSYSAHNFFAKLTRAIHMSVKLLSKLLDASILLQPSGSIPEGPDPPLVRKVEFRMTSASTHSCFNLSIDCRISSNKKCLSA